MIRESQSTFSLPSKLFLLTGIISCFFSLLPLLTFSQSKNANITVSGIENQILKAQIEKSLHRVKDTSDLSNWRTNWQQKMQAEGRLEFSLDAILSQKNEIQLNFHQGPIYIYDQLQLNGLPEVFWEKGGFDRLIDKKQRVNWEGLENKLLYCTNLLQNTGYPFADFSNLDISYDLVAKDTVKTNISYDFDAGPLIKIDSIRIKGNHRERDQFIYNLIRISPGKIYDQSAINEIPKILNNSIYYRRVKAPKVSFTAFETAFIEIDVERKKAGKLDVLLGILPPSTNSQRLEFTGLIDILLVSPLRFGEQIAFKFNKLVASSQQINFDLMIPYLFRIPLKVEAHFDLLKQREDFLNLNAEAAGLFEFSPFLAARFYVKNRSSRLLDSAFRDTSNLNFSQLDGNRQLFGLGLVYENLDYKLNPGKGWSAFLDVGVGRRIIRENFLLKNSYPEVYNGLDLRQPVNEINMEINWYKTIFPRNVIHLANRTYWLGMENYLRNDQLQVGGSRSIRGFNENEFFTDFYSFFTAEYRFQLERDSYMFLFGDYAYLENNETGMIDNPFGVGFGMNYGTKAGIISLIYAIGQSNEIPFQPARGKIHIGFINQF